MTETTNPPLAGGSASLAVAKGRISPALRHAIKLRVEEGHTITDACREAGISEAGWYKAMQRPVVAAYIESESARFIREVDRRRARYKAQAIEVAARLMHKAQSEAVRMRAVEFFAGETKQALVNIDLSGAKKGAGGYVYRRPDDAPTDRASGGDDVQDAEIIDES